MPLAYGRGLSTKSICFQWTAWAALVLYLFTLPQVEYLFNQTWGYWQYCHTPASEIECVNGDNYTDLALSLGRVNSGGVVVGCACGAGVLPDAIGMCKRTCPPTVSTVDMFSLSYFCQTSFGIGATATFTAFPWINLWKDSVLADNELSSSMLTKSDPWKDTLLLMCRFSLFFFHIGFLVYQMLPLHIFPALHAYSTSFFTLSCTVHMIGVTILLLRYSPGWRTWAYTVLWWVACFFLMLFNFWIPSPDDYPFLHYWGFNYAEALWLSVAFLLAPFFSSLLKSDSQQCSRVEDAPQD